MVQIYKLTIIRKLCHLLCHYSILPDIYQRITACKDSLDHQRQFLEQCWG